MPQSVQLIPITGLPLISPGDDLSQLLVHALAELNLTLFSKDILVISQKIVSKAEGCFVNLAELTPSVKAYELANVTGKSAAHVEAILQDSVAIIRARRDLLIVEHRLGFISANGGLDHSNVGHDPNLLLRLPDNPDASAKAMRQKLQQLTGANPPILIIDSHGRAWRKGTVGVVIGLSGLAPVQNLRGTPDLFGELLQHTEVGFTDQIAAAASMLMGQAAEACPIVLVRGLPFEFDEQATAAEVMRPRETDVFR